MSGLHCLALGKPFLKSSASLPEGKGHWLPNWLWIEILAQPPVRWAEVPEEMGVGDKQRRASNVWTFKTNPSYIATVDGTILSEPYHAQLPSAMI